MREPRIPSAAFGRLLVLGLTVLPSTGCATLFHGRIQEIAVTSSPSGAQVFVGDTLIGVTPSRIRFRNGQPLAASVAIDFLTGSAYGRADSVHATLVKPRK